MKTMSKLLIAVGTLGITALLIAQDQPGSEGKPTDGPGPGGPRRHRPPPVAIIGALDANHDGVIDADEIANASEVLKKLDKNGDGQLTPDEFMGPPPFGHPGGPGGPEFRPGPPRDGNGGNDRQERPPDQ